ncbi:MAG: type-F conjugative transfer system secretin TraK [Nitrososphaeria archaeon]
MKEIIKKVTVLTLTLFLLSETSFSQNLPISAQKTKPLTGAIPGIGASLCPPDVEECPAKGEPFYGKDFSKEDLSTPKKQDSKTQKEEKEKEKETLEPKSPPEVYKLPFKKDEVTEGKVVEGIYYVIAPERTTMIQMSSVDINRIICPLPVQDVVFSEEKGVKVKVIDRNVFVKFQVKKIEEKVEYSTTPIDIHVVCNNKVYSLIGFPRKIPAVIVYLEDKELSLKEKVQETSSLNYEEKLAYYVKQFFSGKIPFGAEFIPGDIKHDLYKDLIIHEKGSYVLEGEGLALKFFTVQYVGAEPYVDINERMFLKESLTKSPLAVSLEKLRLNKGETSSLLIVEKKIGREE